MPMKNKKMDMTGLGMTGDKVAKQINSGVGKAEKELEETKKELAALKDKVKASEKSSTKEFSSGSTENVDAGMMNVLRHRHGYI